MHTQETQLTVTADYDVIITQTLLKLGIPANTKGFYYLKAALYFGLDHPIGMTSMSKIVYPAIAAGYYTATPGSIERAMRYAISQSGLRGNITFISSIFGYPADFGKYTPTNREFLAVVSEYIRECCCVHPQCLRSVSA